MGQSTPFDRELAFTDASLSVAAARHSGIKIDSSAEAERILKAFPASGVSLEELVLAMGQLESRDSLSTNAAGAEAIVDVLISASGPEAE